MRPAFVRQTVLQMEGYTPGEQPTAQTRIVKLNTNENPFPPSEKVMAAIRQISPDLLRRYPNPAADAFRAAAAKALDVEAEQIIAANGSDEILTIATRAFVPSGGMLAYPEPTYSLYPILAKLQDARGVSVEWERDWELPTAALLDAGAHAIYLANPNAPSGTFVKPEKIAELAGKFAGALLIDEAYVDFANENCLPLLRKYDNVLIARTLSKSYSLAGLRFGFAVGHPDVIRQMMKVKDSYNCDAISIIAATAAIQDQAYARKSWDYVRTERRRVSRELAGFSWTVLPSQANFILATVPDGQAKEAYLALKQRGILVRFFDLPGLRDKLRITIGLKEQNDALINGISELSAHGPNR